MTKVGGASYLLWAIENFHEFSELAVKLSKFEDEEKIDDKEKMQAILKGLKYMKESCEQLNIKLKNIENDQILEQKVLELKGSV